VTVVLLSLVTCGKMGVGAALRSQAQDSSSPFAGGTAMAGRAAKGRSPGAQAPSHAGNCQTGAVGEGSLQHGAS
jgi:hypothetical protein